MGAEKKMITKAEKVEVCLSGDSFFLWTVLVVDQGWIIIHLQTSKQGLSEWKEEFGIIWSVLDCYLSTDLEAKTLN